MRRTIAIAAWTLALPLLAAGEECDKTSYGAGVTLADSTPVADLLGEPERWVDRDVRVEGEVAEVCEMAGCWLEIRAAEGGQIVKVKVEDGEIVFPVSARGKRAIAQGKFERLDLDRKKYVAYAKHAAEERDLEFDESAIGAGPFKVYQIAGTGAEICR